MPSFNTQYVGTADDDKRLRRGDLRYGVSARPILLMLISDGWLAVRDAANGNQGFPSSHGAARRCSPCFWFDNRFQGPRSIDPGVDQGSDRCDARRNARPWFRLMTARGSLPSIPQTDSVRLAEFGQQLRVDSIRCSTAAGSGRDLRRGASGITAPHIADTARTLDDA